MCDIAYKYVEEFGDNEKIARIAIIKIEHLYYKHDSFYTKVREQLSTTKKASDDIYLINENTTS